MPEDGRKSEAERESLPVMAYAPKRPAKPRGIGMPLGQTMYLTAIGLLIFSVIAQGMQSYAPPPWSYYATLTLHRLMQTTMIFFPLAGLFCLIPGYRRCKPWKTLLIILAASLTQLWLVRYY